MRSTVYILAIVAVAAASAFVANRIAPAKWAQDRPEQPEEPEQAITYTVGALELNARAQRVEFADIVAPVAVDAQQVSKIPSELIPLTEQEQTALFDAAWEFDVPYALALAVIERETNFRNVTGDKGNSLGYMQIQPRWHRGLMDVIGTTDLTDPQDNFRTGCALLADLIAHYNGDVESALTAYNTGHGGTSAYADDVLQKWEAWEDAGL